MNQSFARAFSSNYGTSSSSSDMPVAWRLAACFARAFSSNNGTSSSSSNMPVAALTVAVAARLLCFDLTQYSVVQFISALYTHTIVLLISQSQQVNCFGEMAPTAP